MSPHTHGGTDAPECTTCRTPKPALTTHQLLSELHRPLYVYKMTFGMRPKPDPKSPMERSVRTRHDNALKEIESLLARWKGPDDV